jgi:GNAT superfamily N-acetyltransferase
VGGFVVGELDLVAHARTALKIQAAALATVGNREVGASHLDSYRRHAAYPGFRAVGAWRGDELVGFSYGPVAAPGQWWHDPVAPRLAVRGLGGWITDAYVLVELHVRPDVHGHGVGPRLLDALFAAVNAPRAVLSTDDLDTPARRLYTRLGFVDLIRGFRFSTTARPFAILGAPLPLTRPVRQTVPD